jgi:hypothetical protein
MVELCIVRTGFIADGVTPSPPPLQIDRRRDRQYHPEQVKFA